MSDSNRRQKEPPKQQQHQMIAHEEIVQEEVVTDELVDDTQVVMNIVSPFFGQYLRTILRNELIPGRQ